MEEKARYATRLLALPRLLGSHETPAREHVVQACERLDRTLQGCSAITMNITDVCTET